MICEAPHVIHLHLVMVEIKGEDQLAGLALNGLSGLSDVNFPLKATKHYL